MSQARAVSPPEIEIKVYAQIGDLPVFSPDLEGPSLPRGVRHFIRAIADSDGLLISTPEYVRSIPGGMKNAIDWLVSGDQIVGKPIALVHASHRGDDMLDVLRTVLSAISSNFNKELFLRFPVMKRTPEEIVQTLQEPANRSIAEAFLRNFSTFCDQCRDEAPNSIAV